MKKKIKNDVESVNGKLMLFGLRYPDLMTLCNNKEERCSQIPRQSDIRYSAKGNKGRWRYASSKAKL